MAFNYPSVDFTKDSAGGIQFHRVNFNEALQIAKKENKLVFMDIYATWCGPCKKLKAKTFANQEVGKYFNEIFVNVAFNGEDGEGIELARKYGINSYPTLLFINSDGSIMTGSSGYHTDKELIEFGKSVNSKR